MEQLKSLEDYEHYALIEGPLKVEKIKILHGANYFSAGPIVLIRLNLADYDEVFTNQIPGFYEALKKNIPSLYEHYCSEGKPGGFFIRIKEGTLLGHVIEHVAIELQTLAGMDVAYGKTRSTLKQGVYNIIFRFFDEKAGIFAGKAAINLINSILLNNSFDVNKVIESLIYIREIRLLGPSTQAIVDEVQEREIPFQRLDSYNLVQLGTGKYQKKIRATLTSDTNFIGVETADNKYLTTLMLKDAGIPVLPTIKATAVDDALDFYTEKNSPITIKPLSGYLGKGLSTHLSSKEAITKAFNEAVEFDEQVLVQPFCQGKSYRLLIIDYAFVAATELTPPFVVADGKQSISQLIEEENKKDEREIGDKGKLSIIPIDDITGKLLEKKGLSYESIPKKGEKIVLKHSGNPKLGGISKDITGQVHPFNIFIAERAARAIGLNVAGIDVITEDISQPIDNKGAVLEVNAAPDFRMHIHPALGQPKPVAKKLIDMLFPHGEKHRVPVFSVTGTAGKTMFAFLLDHTLQKEGYTTGLTTSDGLFIAGNKIMEKDATYPEFVSLLFKDPGIDCAVLETSREGILRSGLGYKFADFGIVLNLYDDHVGADDIKYIEDLAYAKSVVAEEVYENGYTVLNADNPLVLEMKERLYSKAVLFSIDSKNKELNGHMFRGGIGVFIKENAIHINHKNKNIKLVELKEIPLTFNNTATFTYDVILAFVATMYAYGMKPGNIKKHLVEFVPSPENLPGRMNFFTIGNYTVLLDYAHNSTNLDGLKEFLQHRQEYKIGILDAAGDRHDEEIIKMGQIASEMFDSVVFYEGFDNRGRDKGEITKLLEKGLTGTGTGKPCSVFHQPQEAWEYGLSQSKDGALVVLLSARSNKTIQFLKNYQTKTNDL